MRAYRMEFHMKTWISIHSRKAFDNAINRYKEIGGNANPKAKETNDIPVQGVKLV